MGAKSKKETKVEEPPVEEVDEEEVDEEVEEESPPPKTKKSPKKGKKSPAKKEKKEPKPRAPRQPVTVVTYNEELDSLVQLIEDDIEKKAKAGEPGSRVLKAVATRLKSLRKKTVKISKVKRTRASGTTVGGFDKKKVITNEFCDFLGLEHGSELSNTEAFMALCVYINLKEGDDREKVQRWAYLQDKKHKGPRCLQNKEANKGSEILPDEKLSKLLHYDEYVKKVKAGEITSRRKNKETGEMESVVVEDHSLKYCTLQKLISHVFE